MSDLRRFKEVLAATTPHPLGLSISKAKGSYIYDHENKAYLDFVAGVSAVSIGHSNPVIRRAVSKQLKRHSHVMVYGEFIQESVLTYAELLTQHLPTALNNVYLVNSGTEAIEGALKLARAATGRTEIIAAKNNYHGNTMGSLSLMDYEERIAPFRPLLPDVKHISFNNTKDLELITTKTAAVIVETIQGGAGFILPGEGYLERLRAQCNKTGSLLILDEIQPGFGRTGKLFGFEHFNCVPDILVIGKGMAGGLPVGAFIAKRSLMQTLSTAPKLGHITTFGGHPVIAAAAHATLTYILKHKLHNQALEHEKTIRALLKHELIKEIRGKGLMLALVFEREEIANYLVLEGLKNKLVLFWLLYEKRAVRITPPLTISKKEIEKGCTIILDLLNRYSVN
ncbi:MAG: aspartate aminotransferase family protein [Flavobacteriaceae bacterium]